MMDRLGESAKLDPPEDGTITTMYIGGLTPAMSEDDIREPFTPFGEVRRCCPPTPPAPAALVSSTDTLIHFS